MDITLIAKLGKSAALGMPDVRTLLKMNPALTSTLLGGIVGAGVSGEGLRVRGALTGAAGGLAGGLAGAGLLHGTGSKGLPNKAIMKALGSSPSAHQHMGGAAGGLLAGAFTQPKPTPILMSGNRKSTGSLGMLESLEQAKNSIMSAKPEIERI